MKLFTKTYLRTLLTLLIAFGAYRVIVVPAIEPRIQPKAEIPDYAQVLGRDRWWNGLFPAGAWQVDNPTIVQNGRGVLLASSWEQIGPKTWKLQPLSMILPRSGVDTPHSGSQSFAEQDVWIVNAEQGAVIHFEEPFDLRSANVPAVERGQLDGAITITRRSVGKASEHPWSLTTSDLSIDRRRISTQSSVTIQWAESIIRGRDLRVMLRRDVLGGSDQDDETSGWGPLDELELYHVDELNVALPPGGLWASASPSLFKGKIPSRDLPARLEATCGGRFAFDFKQSTATLTNGVRLWHFLGQLPPDEFSSHKVSLRVEPPAKDQASEQAISMGGVQIKELVALGIDSLQDFVGEQWVELRAPTLDAAARAKRLRVDFDQQRVELAGKLEQPGATQSIAWLEYQGYEFRSPAIEYQAGPTLPDGSAEHAGWLVAEGPGELTTVAGSDANASQVRWQRALKMAPAESPGEQWVELTGSTLIENKRQGFMTAERIQVWLKKNEGKSVGAGDGTAPRYLPDRVLATGDTVLATSDMKAHVGTMQLQLVYGPRQATPAAEEPTGLQLNDSVGTPKYQFVNPPASTSTPTTSESPVRSTSGNPVVIHGQSLKSTIVSAGDQNWVDALTVEGPLLIEGKQQKQADLPWHIEGDQLRLATNAAGQVDLQIDGLPARIVVAEGALEGPSIRFDQRNNLVWMDQPGEFTIPTSAVSEKGQQLSTLEWIKPPHCSWSGRMMFDGTVARIEGDIELDGVARQPDELWLLKGYCQRLDLAMDDPIDLRSTQRDASAKTPALQRIILQDNVDLRVQQTDLQGNTKSLERIVVPILTFHVAEQQVVGGGPGWINSRFLAGAGGLGQLASNRSARAVSPRLQGAHLAFRDSLVGFLDRNEFVFDGRVELAAGPLKSWNETIELANMTRLQLEQMLVNCDQLKIYDTSGLSSTGGVSGIGKQQALEFQATGNVVFEGKTDSGTYSGNGHRITYVQAKDQLRLLGDGRRPALVKQIPNDPQIESTSAAYVNEATINIKTMEIQILKLSQYRLDFPQAGQPSSGVLGPPSLDGRAGEPSNAAPPNPRRGFQFLSADEQLAEML